MKHFTKWLAVLLAGVMLLTGCGAPDAAGADTAAEDKTGIASADTDTEKSMGRYLEKEVELPEEVRTMGTYPIGCMRLLDSGELELVEQVAGKYISKDNGETWEHVDTPWLSELSFKAYISQIALAPNGAMAVIHDSTDDEGYDPAYLFADADGNTKPIEFTENGNHLHQFWFGTDSTLYAFDMNGNVYEADVESGSMKKLFDMEGLSDYVGFTERYMVLVGSRGLTLYDLQEGITIEDKVLSDFVAENGKYIGSSTDGHVMVAVGGGQEDVLYFALESGLYRHVIGGTALEQVIDGSINSMGDPMMSLQGLEVLADNEFLVLYNDVKLCRYVYDPDIPTVPEEQLGVYSLKENYAIRQAVSLFQKQNPEVYVRYEVGLTENSGMTAEDAIKNLNTKLMSGSGPNILVLDGLPADSYKEKGILEDVSALEQEMTGENSLFPNVVDACREDGKLYELPVRFRIPLLAGQQETVEKIKNLKTLADTMEELRRENPEGSLLGVWAEEEVIDLLGLTSSAAWVDENGNIDEENLTEFLTQAKRIYEAELSGLDEQEVEAHRESFKKQWSANVIGEDRYYTDTAANAMDIAIGSQKLAAGVVSRVDFGYDMITTMARQEEDLVCGLWTGQVQGGFRPNTMVGICSGSMENELAVEFYRFLFGRDLQDLDLLGGFPVNVASFENFRKNPRGDDEEAGGVSMSTTNGDDIFSLDVRWTNDEEFDHLLEMAQSVSRNCAGDSMIEQAVYEIGIKALNGSSSVEDAVAEIVKKAAIYLAE